MNIQKKIKKKKKKIINFKKKNSKKNYKKKNPYGHKGVLGPIRETPNKNIFKTGPSVVTPIL